MNRSRPGFRLAFATLVSLLGLAPAATRGEPAGAVEADLDNFRRDPQCGSKAALDALGQFFQAQGENLVAAGRSAGKLAEAAGRARPAAREAASALSELGRIAADVAAAGPDAVKDSGALAKAIGDLEKDASAVTALGRGNVSDTGVALESSVRPLVAACAGCASAMAGAASRLAGGGPGAPGGSGLGTLAEGPCGQAHEEAMRIDDAFSRIRSLTGSAAAFIWSIRMTAEDLAAAADALAGLERELGTSARPSLRRIEDGLNRSIDAITAAGQTYDAGVAPHVANLAPSLLQQIADNTNRLLACHEKLQDVSGRKARRLSPIRAGGSLGIPAGPTLARPIAKIRLGAPPPAKVP